MQFHLKYRCKTTPEIFMAKRNIDRTYTLQSPDGSIARYPGSKLRKEFRFLGDLKPKKRLILKGTK